MVRLFEDDRRHNLALFESCFRKLLNAGTVDSAGIDLYRTIEELHYNVRFGPSCNLTSGSSPSRRVSGIRRLVCVLPEGSSVRIIKTRRFGDERGWFTETYSARSFASLGIEATFVQDNHSLSRLRGTVRGLHFQAPPHAQAKLVRCIRGRIFDVAVDVRGGSPTYGQTIGAELCAESGDQLYVPIGFAHGFMTLEANTEVVYKVSEFYNASSEGGVRWNDPDLAIAWPLAANDALLSPKDLDLPTFADLVSPFRFEGAPLAPPVV